MNLSLLLGSVRTSRKGIFFMLSSEVNFSTEFFYKGVNFIVGLCGNKDIYIADIYFGFFYCVQYFVFDVGCVKFGYNWSKG